MRTFVSLLGVASSFSLLSAATPNSIRLCATKSTRSCVNDKPRTSGAGFLRQPHRVCCNENEKKNGAANLRGTATIFSRRLFSLRSLPLFRYFRLASSQFAFCICFSLVAPHPGPTGQSSPQGGREPGSQRLEQRAAHRNVTGASHPVIFLEKFEKKCFLFPERAPPLFFYLKKRGERSDRLRPPSFARRLLCVRV